MKPDAAAERLAEVKIELAAGILMKLDPRQASTILNEMDSKAAATITGVMASATPQGRPVMIRLALAALALAGLAGCGSTAFKEIGVPPALSPVGSGLAAEGSSIYNYPEKPAAPVKKFSLWDDRQSRLFTDPARAARPATS